MNFNILDDIKNIKCEDVFFSQFFESLESLLEKVNAKLSETTNIEEGRGTKSDDYNPLSNEKCEKSELYYVYAYMPEKVYITKQGSNKLELLEGVTEEFKRNLAEGFILRYKDGKFTVDEELTEKSMNFELDFENCKE